MAPVVCGHAITSLICNCETIYALVKIFRQENYKG